MGSKKILSFSIGPVQSYISQARKTKDLFSGSKLLSDIVDCVIRNFNSKKYGQVILPHEKVESKPNRFIAIIDEGYDAKKVAEELENTARARFLEIAEETYNKVFGDNEVPVGFKEQIEDFLDINWVAIDYEEEKYQEIYNELDMLMGAVKNTRIYKQIKYPDSDIGEAGRKCSICGERNSIFFKKALSKFYDSSRYRVVKDNFISENESLCGVCFVKRYYEKFDERNVNSFPPTAQICLMNVLSKLNMNQRIIDDPELNRLGEFTVDLLFEENNNLEYIKENGMLHRDVEDEQVKRIIEKLKEIENEVKEKAKKEKGLKLSRYYAIISFDGDSMGKWLSGEKVDLNKCTLLDFHEQLSKLVGEFSKEVKKTIVEPRGKIVYAGGEDFLGFVNLEYLFDVMLTLRSLFDAIVNKPLKKYFQDENDNLSFSAGMSISHYKITLSNSIIWAKKMEKEAKKINGKNGFAIALLKRSGDGKVVKFRWQENESDEFTIINEIKSVIDNLKNGYFSNSFIYGLGKIMNKLPKKYETVEDIETVDAAIKTEIYRLVKRSFNIEKFKEKDKVKIDEMTNLLVNIFNKSRIEKEDQNPKDNFMDLLYILSFLVEEVYY